MQRLPGNYIAYGWAARSEASKALLFEQLRAMIAQIRGLRRLSASRTEVSNVDGGPIMDMRLLDKSLWGPYTTVEGFQSELRRGIAMEHIKDDTILGLKELISFHARNAETESVLTHGDLSSFNIMVSGDKITGIVDWETAGWLPWYWEYVNAWNVNPHNRFWRGEVDKFLEPSEEAKAMDAIRLKYFGDI